MHKIHIVSKRDAAIKRSVNFKFAKFIAALCIMASAAVSIIAIVWSVNALA
jgi:hypothetical protein